MKPYEINALDELVEHIEGRTILCAFIQILNEDWEIGDPNSEYTTVASLKIGYSDKDDREFMEALNFGYINQSFEKHLEGIVWFTDHTWMERRCYDDLEWWELMERPIVPHWLTDRAPDVQ